MITLNMIVKNEAEMLPICLKSVRPFVSEIVIVDTGSSDATVEIAKAFDANVYFFDWIDDFSAARNAALSFVKTPWTLWLDADDMVLNPEGLTDLTEQAHRERLSGLWALYRQDESCYQRRLSLFKTKAVRWEGVVHENPIPKNPYFETAFCDLEIRHRKPHSRCFDAAKRYLDILLQKEPNNWLGIAESYKLLAQTDPTLQGKAFDYFWKAYQAEGAHIGTQYLALFQAAKLAMQRAIDEKDTAAMEIAFKVAQLGLTLLPERAECLVVLGQLYHAIGDTFQAKQFYEQALQKTPPQNQIGVVFDRYYQELPQSLLNLLPLVS